MTLPVLNYQLTEIKQKQLSTQRPFLISSPRILILIYKTGVTQINLSFFARNAWKKITFYEIDYPFLTQCEDQIS